MAGATTQDFGASIVWSGLVTSRRSLLALALGIGALRAVAGALPGPRRIGVLSDAWAADHPTVLGLKEGLRELGLAEGREVSYNVRFTQGRPEAAPELARSLVEGGVDVLFAVGAASALAAKSAGPGLPMVFAQVGDPVAVGIVSELARPGGNVTGVSGIAADLMPKRIEILKTLVPELRRIWVVSAPGDPVVGVAAAGVRDAAAALGLTVETVEVSGTEQLDLLRDNLRAGDGVLAPGGESLDLAGALLRLSLATRAPAIFPSSLWVGYGGLVSYGPDFFAQGTQAARLLAKILGGAVPGELPVESADVLDLALNLGTASAMSINVPRKILLRANTIRR